MRRVCGIVLYIPPMMNATGPVFLGFSGIVAGFVDSIAGGGGLITLPALSLAVGQGVAAVATNKICGLTASAVALLVYVRRGHMDWRNSTAFAVAVAGGGLTGSRIAPLLPGWVFPWLLVVTCPVILWVVWERDLWVGREVANPDHRPRSALVVAGCGAAIGVYDGVWGPGSGTFMFLALLFVARQPLLPSLAAAKLANTASAAVALASYGISGHVHVREGSLVALGTVAGGYVGANMASARAAKVVRPVLAVVVILLVIKFVAQAVRGG